MDSDGGSGGCAIMRTNCLCIAAIMRDRLGRAAAESYYQSFRGVSGSISQQLYRQTLEHHYAVINGVDLKAEDNNP